MAHVLQHTTRQPRVVAATPAGRALGSAARRARVRRLLKPGRWCRASKKTSLGTGQDGKLAANFDRLHAVLRRHLDDADSRHALCAAICKVWQLLGTVPSTLESAVDAVVVSGLTQDHASEAQELLQRPKAIRDGGDILRRAACGRMLGFGDELVWDVVASTSSIDRWIARSAFACVSRCAPPPQAFRCTR